MQKERQRPSVGSRAEDAADQDQAEEVAGMARARDRQDENADAGSWLRGRRGRVRLGGTINALCRQDSSRSRIDGQLTQRPVPSGSGKELRRAVYGATR